MRVLLLQLPIPQLSLGIKTGNIPLAAAYLAQAVKDIKGLRTAILPQALASYLGDGALIDLMASDQPQLIGFSVFSWNLERSLSIAQALKKKIPVQIVFGGPEITANHAGIPSDIVDVCIYGEGEFPFKALLHQKIAAAPLVPCKDPEPFTTRPNPYLSNLLDPAIDEMMYLETQRGCPFKCGFCYYHKSRGTPLYATEKVILDSLAWALFHQVTEICFLDPSFTQRPGILNVLKAMTLLNTPRKLAFNAEIRADLLSETVADGLAQAGFTWVETGLQSINEAPLRLMGRPTNLNRFIKGIQYLKERDIQPRIDLIVGLPGDTPEGFRDSLRFIAENDLSDDVQIFPLAVLPGTAFRKNAKSLGIIHESAPPYTIIETPTFSHEDLLLAFDEAESLLDISLFPSPIPDLSFYVAQPNQNLSDLRVKMDGRVLTCKVIPGSKDPLERFHETAQRLTHPYQVVIPPQVADSHFIKKMLAILTRKNPFTPFEIIFLNPPNLPNIRDLNTAIHLKRPQYLDNDLKFLYGKPGNRTVMFSLVTPQGHEEFYGAMLRQFIWWQHPVLPEIKKLTSLFRFDGVLLDPRDLPLHEIHAYQDSMSPHADKLPHISFAEAGLQKRWRQLTAPESTYTAFFNF